MPSSANTPLNSDQIQSVWNQMTYNAEALQQTGSPSVAQSPKAIAQQTKAVSMSGVPATASTSSLTQLPPQSANKLDPQSLEHILNEAPRAELAKPDLARMGGAVVSRQKAEGGFNQSAYPDNQAYANQLNLALSSLGLTVSDHGGPFSTLGQVCSQMGLSTEAQSIAFSALGQELTQNPKAAEKYSKMSAEELQRLSSNDFFKTPLEELNAMAGKDLMTLSPQEFLALDSSILSSIAQSLKLNLSQTLALKSNPNINAVSASSLSSVDLTLIAFVAGAKAGKENANSLVQRMNSISNQTIAASNAQLSQLNDSYDQMAKSAKWGKWGQIFGWTAAVVGLVVAIGLTLASGGAAWPLLAASLIGIGIMVDASTGGHVMTAVTNALTDVADIAVKATADLISFVTGGSVTISQDTEDKISKALGVVLTAALVIASMLALTCMGDPEGAMELAAKKGGKWLVSVIKIAPKLINGAALIAAGGSQAVSSVYGYQGQKAQIASKEWGALITELEQYSKQTSKMVQALMQSISDSNQTAFELLTSMANSLSSVDKNLASA